MISDTDKKRNMEQSGQEIFFQIAGVLFLIFIVVLVIADFNMYKKKQGLAGELSVYQKKIDDLEKSGQTLKEEIANSENADYLEKIAYEQGMVKAGEKEVIFVSPKQQQKPQEPVKNFWQNFSGWLSGSWQWIKSKF